MKGVVFNLLEAAVARAYGENTWDDLLEAAGAEGVYTSLGNYDDTELEALIAAAQSALKINRDEVLRWFGRNAMPIMAELYPGFFTPHTSARPFVVGVNDIIHREVRKLYSGTSCPHFGIRAFPDGRLGLTYQSKRRMCALAVGFIEGAADWYKETVEIEHIACTNHGHSHCELHLRWIDDSAKAA